MHRGPTFIPNNPNLGVVLGVLGVLAVPSPTQSIVRSLSTAANVGHYLAGLSGPRWSRDGREEKALSSVPQARS